jgi:hypothetical protein
MAHFTEPPPLAAMDAAIPDDEPVGRGAWRALLGSALGYAMDGFDLCPLSRLVPRHSDFDWFNEDCGHPKVRRQASRMPAQLKGGFAPIMAV